MNASEIEIRKKIDLHYDRKDYSANKNYVEFFFGACFSDIFNLDSFPWTYSRDGIKRNITPTKNGINGSELFDILKELRINCDEELLFNKYLDEQNHSVEVFHCSGDEQVFAYFDLYKAPDDQLDFFFFGISCKRENEWEIHQKLLSVYRKLETASSFTFSILEKNLYYKVFRSYFYFYGDDYNAIKRQMHHNNLPSNKY